MITSVNNLFFGLNYRKNVVTSRLQKVFQKIHAKDIRVYLSGENLWTWSPMYKWTKDTDVTSIYGSDRDLSGGTSGDGYNYPMLKVISLGLNVNF